jgi:hypothetical protein
VNALFVSTRCLGSRRLFDRALPEWVHWLNIRKRERARLTVSGRGRAHDAAFASASASRARVLRLEALGGRAHASASLGFRSLNNNGRADPCEQKRTHTRGYAAATSSTIWRLRTHWWIWERERRLKALREKQTKPVEAPDYFLVLFSNNVWSQNLSVILCFSDCEHWNLIARVIFRLVNYRKSDVVSILTRWCK